MTDKLTYNYKVFAFALQFKRVQSNGEWYDGISLHRLLKTRLRLKSSYNSLKQYVETLEKLGCFVKKGNGKHKQLKNYYEIADILNIDIDKKYINQYMKDVEIEKLKTNTAANELIKILYKYKLKAQKKCVDKYNAHYDLCKILIAGTRYKGNKKPFYKDVKHIRRRAKGENLTYDNYIKSTVDKGKDKLVTGCYHLAINFKISRSKANKLVQDLVNEGFMARKIIKEVIYCDKENFPLSLLEGLIGVPKVHYPFAHGFVYVRGSEITINDTPYFMPSGTDIIYHNLRSISYNHTYSPNKVTKGFKSSKGIGKRFP